MSIRTESADVQWITDSLHFHKKQAGCWRHPSPMSSQDVNQFLTHLAVDRHVAASTQNQAFSALLFLFQHILKMEIQLDAVRAKHPARLLVMLSQDEVKRVLCAIPQGPFRIMAGLMYGAGLRRVVICLLRGSTTVPYAWIHCYPLSSFAAHMKAL